jgi:hypothetical protein
LIFTDAGFTSRTSILLSAATVAPQLVVLGIVVLRLDRVGRKPPLLFSMAGLTVGFGALVAAYAVPEFEARGWITVAR